MYDICFVTDEVMPFTRGGIGAFVRNTLDHYTRFDKIAVLYTGQPKISMEEWSLRFPKAKLYQLADFSSGRRHRWENTYFDHPFMRRSMIIMEYLRELRKLDKFKVIEFMDWGGLSFYTQQAKLAKLDFFEEVISVRIHTTEGVLRKFEGRPPGFETALLVDFERKALADADIVVAHLRPVAQYVSDFYGMPEDWAHSLHISAPPISTPSRTIMAVAPDASNTDILFTSKLQSVKRPDVFVSGACMFLEEHVSYRGKIVLTAFEPIPGWSDRLLAMVPDKLKSRFQFVDSMDQKLREELISNSVVVFPNAYEAFCFAAYEASLMGGLCVLNSNNVAFSEDTPWKDGTNCIKFDGTARGLASSLSKVFFGPINKLRAVQIEADDTPYWRDDFAAVEKNSSDATAAVVFLIKSSSMLNIKNLLDFLNNEEKVEEIILVFDADDDIEHSIFFAKVRQLSSVNTKIKVVYFRSKIGTSRLLNLALESVTSEFVFLVPGAVEIMPGFLSAALNALTDSVYDVVLPISTLINDRSDLSDVPVRPFFPIGEGVQTNLLKNRLAEHSFVARSCVAKRTLFNEQLNFQYEWDFLLRMAADGVRMIAWPEVVIGYTESISAALAPPSDIEVRTNTQIIRENITWSTKGGNGSLVLLNDAPQKEYHREIVVQNSSNSDVHDILNTIKTSYNQYFDRARTDRNVVVRGLRTRIFQRLYVHIEQINDAVDIGNEVRVQKGQDVAAVGWWRTKFLDHENPVFELVLKREGVLAPFSTSMNERMDVAMTYHLPTYMKLGFNAVLGTGSLDRGKYQLFGRLYLRGKVVLRAELLSVLIE